MGFRRRLLVLTTVLMAVIGTAGVMAALLFDRALDNAVALEVNSGRVLRAARDLQYVLLQQRERFIEMQFVPPSPARDAIETTFYATRADVIDGERELLAATRGDAELEARSREVIDALSVLRARIDALHPPTEPLALARFVASESGPLTGEMERRMSALIEEVRTRQALEMNTMQAHLARRLFVLAVAFLAVVALGGGLLLWFLDRYFARPMARAIHIATDVAAGVVQQRIPVDRSDEFGVFAEAFNRMLEELIGINQRLEDANRDLESFSYAISHDLRAPLRAINGFAQILREDTGERLDAVQLGYLERIGAAATRMSTMIQGMLDFAHVGRGDLRGQPLDLSNMAMEVLAELRAADVQRAVEVTIEPDVRAWGDAGLMRSVLDNLLGNAWKYTARTAAARIQFGACEVDGARGFFVRDNGAGFDPAFAGNLFRPFGRLHTDAEFEGTGIGLATVERIVHRHGGRIRADARPGMGATFQVMLTAEPGTALP